MRDIEFRWKTIEWKWVYGYYYVEAIDNEDKIWFDYVHFIKYVYGDHFSDVEVLPESVWQWTGLEDKNWKKIYEGDIVNWKQASGWLLESLRDDKTYTCFIDFFMDWWCCRLNKDHLWFTLSSEHIEIIWNIYENPELLTK